MRLICPHCKAKATIRTSRPMSDISRELSLQCSNLECAHTWVSLVSAVRTIAPSMTPDPHVYIPLSPRSPAAVPPGRQPELALDHPHARAMSAGP